MCIAHLQSLCHIGVCVCVNPFEFAQTARFNNPKVLALLQTMSSTVLPCKGLPSGHEAPYAANAPRLLPSEPSARQQDTHYTLVCPTTPHIPAPCIPGDSGGGGGAGLRAKRQEKGKTLDGRKIFIDHNTKPTYFDPPPGIEPGPSGQRTTPVATMAYRRGQITCPKGRTGGATTLHVVSQPSLGFEPPPTACETHRMPFIYRDNASLHYHLSDIYRVSPHR